jgi:hypothetical protein
MFSVTRDLMVLPDDPQGVCAIISDFLESWRGVSAGSLIEEDQSKVSEAERRIGFTLPTALRWLLTHVGCDNSIVGHQDPLVSPQALAIDNAGVLVYRVENQNCAQWGVRVADLAKADPPVVWKDPADSEWSPYLDRLSVDLLEMALSEVMLLRGSNLLQAELVSGVPSELNRLHRLAIPEHVFWASPDGPPVEWYGLHDCLVRNDGGEWLWAFGRSSADVREIARLVPVEWDRLDS